jgi:hypothetical protein
VVLIDRELMKRSWYLRYLEQRHPEVLEGSRNEIRTFLFEVDKFERKLPYDGAVLEGAFAAMISSVLSTNLRTRPVYVTPEIEPAYLGGLGRLPAGVVFRLYDREPPAFVSRELPYRPFPKDNVYFRMLAGYYAAGYANQGLYFGMRGELAGSEYFLRKALTAKPDYREAMVWLGQVQQAKAARATQTRESAAGSDSHP